MRHVHVITHTHWDREWYRTYEEFRVFLVQLLDDLLDYLEVNEAYSAFLLDGQTVQLEDYLEVRPDQEQALRKHVEDGRLLIGPMYIQPDEYVPSGESLVRNFLVGRRIADRFGGMMNLGYFPDSFGQASQMPQILQGFGIDTVVFWRGLCDDDSEKTELRWQSRDGSEVLAIWMPFSYGNAHTMSSDPEKAAAFVRQTLDVLGPMATTDHILLTKGWDHSFFSPWVPETIQKAAALLEGTCEITHSTLPDFVEAVRSQIPDTLKVLEGDFRNAKTMRIHPGISSTRMDIKQLNRRTEKLLEKAVEPVYTLAAMGGATYPAAMIRTAWKYALQSQAHDSLCCCCTDQALKAVADRYRRANEIGTTLLTQGIHALARQVKTNSQDGQPFVVVNPLAQERDDLVQVEVMTQMDDAGLVDFRGNPVPFQILDHETLRMGFDPSVAAMSGETTEDELLDAVGQRPDNPEIYYDQRGYVPISDEAEGIRMHRLRLAFPAEFGGSGWKTYYLQPGKSSVKSKGTVHLKGNVLENEHLRVELQPDGRFHLIDKAQGIRYDDVHVFVDDGDAGDSYNYSPPVKDRLITSERLPAEIETMGEGPLLAGWRVRIHMDVPSGLSDDGMERGERNESLTITSEITLGAGDHYVSIQTEVVNRAEDHRLRVHIPTGVKTDVSFAEEQFGVISRPNRRPEMDRWEDDGWVEAPLAIYQQQTFVDVNDGEHGLAVLNRDLTEYEVLDGEQSILALTLYRSVGAMGRPNLVIRPGRASGLTVPTPDSNLMTTLTFHYAVYPHRGDFSSVGGQAARYTSPHQAVQTNRHEGTREGGEAALSLSTHGLVPSCLKRAEWRDGYVLRFYNATSAVIDDAILQSSMSDHEAAVVDLKEDNVPGTSLEACEQGWRLPPVKPSQLMTVFIGS